MKSCEDCFKNFDYPGLVCHWCGEKRRLKKTLGIICSRCNRNDGFIVNKTHKLCNTCYHKRLEENLVYKEKKRLAKFKSRRKGRGQDPDAPLMKKRSGEGHLDRNGYIQITKLGHPNCTSKTGRIAEHTYIMSLHLNRALSKDESVHHKNGIRNDNRLENLEIWHKGQPAGQRLTDKIAWAKKFLEQYEYTVTTNSTLT